MLRGMLVCRCGPTDFGWTAIIGWSGGRHVAVGTSALSGPAGIEGGAPLSSFPEIDGTLYELYDLA